MYFMLALESPAGYQTVNGVNLRFGKPAWQPIGFPVYESLGTAELIRSKLLLSDPLYESAAILRVECHKPPLPVGLGCALARTIEPIARVA